MKKYLLFLPFVIFMASCDNVKEAAGVVDSDDYEQVCYELEKAEKKIKELESEISDLEDKNRDLSNTLIRYKNDDEDAVIKLNEIKRDLNWGSIESVDELNQRIDNVIYTLQ